MQTIENDVFPWPLALGARQFGLSVTVHGSDALDVLPSLRSSQNFGGGVGSADI